MSLLDVPPSEAWLSLPSVVYSEPCMCTVRYVLKQSLEAQLVDRPLPILVLQDLCTEGWPASTAGKAADQFNRLGGLH